MLLSDFKSKIQHWNEWAAQDNCKQFDIALFKIWITFETFCSELFTNYCLGVSSETGYLPHLSIDFHNEELLNVFMRERGKNYVDYFAKIELSKYIFVNNPFDILLVDPKYKNACDQIKSIRNYIAHESNEAKNKYIKMCFCGNPNHFLEPNDYLVKIESSTKKSYYTYYTQCLSDISWLLVNPPN